jgi:hypothetical protein
VGRAEPAAATRDEAHRPASQEAIKPPEILVVFERDMMAHRDVALAQPCGGTGRKRHPTIVDAHQPPAVCGVDGKRDVLDPIQAGGSSAICDKDNLVGLPDCHPRPVGGFLVRQIEDQLAFTLDRVQPIDDGRVVQLQLWKALSDIRVAEKEASSRACKGTA